MSGSDQSALMGVRTLARRDNCLTFGVMVPHFGEHASRERIIAGSRLVEELGFDAIWVRDHLLWTPHAHEGTNVTFVEPLMALAAAAAVTSRIVLGTAVLIPLRWPLKLAQDLAALSYLSNGRVVAGLGAGHFREELAAVGLEPDSRQEIVAETVEIMRRVWSEETVDYRGELFSFSNVRIEPKPVQPLPLWYGGTTQAAIRRVLSTYDGWLPGGVPLETLDARLAYLQDRCADLGRDRPVIAYLPRLAIDKDRTKALSDLDVEKLSNASEGSKYWIKPPSGRFTALSELRGMFLGGDPSDIVEQILELAARPIDHLIFDLRNRFASYEEHLELIATEVLPAVRAALRSS